MLVETKYQEEILFGDIFLSFTVHRKSRKQIISYRKGSKMLTLLLYKFSWRQEGNENPVITWWTSGLSEQSHWDLACPFTYLVFHMECRDSGTEYLRTDFQKDRCGYDNRSCFLLSVKTSASDNLFDLVSIIIKQK